MVYLIRLDGSGLLRIMGLYFFISLLTRVFSIVFNINLLTLCKFLIVYIP